MLEIAIYTILFIVAFIIFELLRTLGFYACLMEVIYTHPDFDKTIRILGRVFEGLGVGIFVSAYYASLTGTAVAFSVFGHGIIWLAIGAIMLEYKNK